MDEQNEDQDGIERGPGGTPGARLGAARQAAGLSLAEVAAETRIAARHLALIEADEYGQLPGRTYAVGFSRTYAKLVGLDEAEIAGDVRAVLDAAEPDRYRHATNAFEPGDPARVPSSRLGWLMALAALLLLAGGYNFFRSSFSPGGELPALSEPAAPRPAARVARPAPRQAVSATGAVVFTALEDGIWVKFYDGQGRQLMQKQMGKGESYTIPAAAQAPQLWTGRPDALAISIGGRAVPRLAERERVMKDVPVTAAALLARKEAPAREVPPTG